MRDDDFIVSGDSGGSARGEEARRVYLPLQGPNGARPKAPKVAGWQSPSFEGISAWSTDAWIGLRTDGLVVIDCDTPDAAIAWIERTQLPNGGTWVRKTPRGFHFIYRAVPGAPDGPLVGVFEHVDVRAGNASQIVFHATGYYDETPEVALADFEPTWLPPRSSIARDADEWDEIPDGRGNNTMTALAGALRRQGASHEVMLKVLAAVNRLTMTRDPMPLEMIASIANSVSRYTPDPDIDIVLDDEDDEMEPGEPPSRIKTPTVFTDVELDALRLPELSWMLKGILPEGVTLLAGKPKVGKSWLSLGLALAVAEGGSYLGRSVEQGDVLYLALEDTPGRLRRRLEKVRAGRQATGRLTFATAWPRMPEAAKPIIEWIKRVEAPRLIIVDTLAKIRHDAAGKGYDYADDYKALELLKRIGDASNVGIVVVHHERKLDGQDPLDTVSGTTGLTGAADSILVLKKARADDYRLLGRGRDLEDDLEHDLRFDRETVTFALSELRIVDESAIEKPDFVEWLVTIVPVGEFVPKTEELAAVAKAAGYTSKEVEAGKRSVRQDQRFEPENPSNPRSRMVRTA
jgi:hypothetical protein